MTLSRDGDTSTVKEGLSAVCHEVRAIIRQEVIREATPLPSYFSFRVLQETRPI